MRIDERVVLVAEIVEGPDRAPARRIDDGRISIGRSPMATITVDDPTVSAHHAFLIVETDGGRPSTCRVVDLVGGRRTDVDQRPVSGDVVVDISERPLRLTVGCSVVVLRSVGVAVTEPITCGATPTRLLSVGDGRQRVAERPFAPASPSTSRTDLVSGDAHSLVTPPEIPTLPSGPTATALVGATVGLVGALVVAELMASIMFLALAAVGAGVAVVTHLGGWANTLRRRRSIRARWQADLRRLDAGLVTAARAAERRARAIAPGIDPAVETVAHHRDPASGTVDDDLADTAPALWQTRWNGDPVDVVVGVGSRPWNATDTEPSVDGRAWRGAPGADRRRGAFAADLERRLAAAPELDDVPVVAAIRTGSVVAVTGALRSSVARSIVAQIAWHVGPADASLAVITDRPDDWSWVRRLPHGGASGDAAVVAAGDLMTDCARLSHRLARADRWLVVLDAGRHVDRDRVVRAAVAGTDAALLVVDEVAPAWADDEVATCVTGRVAVRTPERAEERGGRAIGVSAATARAIASMLDGLVDPESPSAALVDRCSFADAHGACAADERVDPFDAASIIGAWRCCGPDPAPAATIGVSSSGAEWIDLVRDGPHAIVAGTTGAGKSELLRTLVAALAVRSSPAQLSLLLIDYKGGAAFDACTHLPHVVGVVTDLDDGLAARCLRSLDAELHRRERLLRTLGASDLAEYRAASHDVDGAAPIARLVIVVDEFAALAQELPAFLSSLVDIGRRGRSLGVHLVLATQRPGGVVSDDLRANTGLRLSLRVNTASESTDVVGLADAAAIDRACPGRAVRALDGGGVRAFQTACCTLADGGVDTELSVVVDAVRRATVEGGVELPAAPWCPPLPDVIAPGELGRLLDAAPPAETDGAASSARDRIASIVPVGAIDDPNRQCRRPLTWSPGEGSLALIGRDGAGSTSTILSVVAAACASATPADLHVYVIDALGDRRLDALASVAHCGGVVRADDTELLRRLITRLQAPRAGGRAGPRPSVVVVVDGLESLRSTLRERADPAVEREVVDALTTPDPGIELIVSARAELGALRSMVRDVWVGAVDDPATARANGWRGRSTATFVPGRVGVVSSQLEAHVALGAPGLAELPSTGGPIGLTRLPADVSVDRLVPASASGVSGRAPADVVPIGLDAVTLEPAGPRLGPGDHLALIGRPSSGVSTALATIARQWQRRQPNGAVRWLRPSTMADAEASTDGEECALWIVDDADRVDDASGVLAGIIDGTSPLADRVSLVVGMRLDAHRQAFGHWARGLASGERGIALAASGDAPTDVFGAAAPRRPLVAARPGLGWLVEAGTVQAIQIAR